MLLVPSPLWLPRLIEFVTRSEALSKLFAAKGCSMYREEVTSALFHYLRTPGVPSKRIVASALLRLVSRPHLLAQNGASVGHFRDMLDVVDSEFELSVAQCTRPDRCNREQQVRVTHAMLSSAVACYLCLNGPRAQQLGELLVTLQHAVEVLSAPPSASVIVPTSLERRRLSGLSGVAALYELRRILLAMQLKQDVPSEWLCVAIAEAGYTTRLRLVAWWAYFIVSLAVVMAGRAVVL